METKSKINIIKFADELESDGDLEMYWDYNDKLSEEQILKILTTEDGINDIENEIFDMNIDYVGEIVNEKIKDLDLTDDEKDELRMECESRFNYNIKGLIKRSTINLRVELLTNEDMIYIPDIKNSYTFKEFKRIFKGKYKKEDLEREINNCQDYAIFTFYFKIGGEDILLLREQILKGFITLRKGLFFGLFDSFNGGGSLLEIGLLKDVTLTLKDWRIKNTKDEVVRILEEGHKKSYYEVMIKGDNISKYGVQQVYGLSSWQEW